MRLCCPGCPGSGRVLADCDLSRLDGDSWIPVSDTVPVADVTDVTKGSCCGPVLPDQHGLS